VRADVASLNLDTTESVLGRLAERRGGQSAGRFKPLDVEKPLADYTPPTDVPNIDDIRQSITVPDVPQEFPAVTMLLEQMLKEPLDPWQLESVVRSPSSVAGSSAWPRTTDHGLRTPEHGPRTA
jgi:hypothetical protein